MKGRYDSNEIEDQRLWQLINKKNLNKTKSFGFLGFKCDEGVKRNLGRLGTFEGPNAIRTAMASMPIHSLDLEIKDYGDVEVVSTNLEECQNVYSGVVTRIINDGIIPIGLGGGHSIAYGTYTGIKNSDKYKNKKIGIINFDAHLDMRPYDQYPTSGTSFKQIGDCEEDYRYMIIGYQKIGNTIRLLNTCKELGGEIISAEDVEFNSMKEINNKIIKFINSVDYIYVTLCMDVFDIADAMGVSAPSAVGLNKAKGIKLFENILDTGKVVAVDFAEVNPELDIDNRTGRLVAYIINKIID
ncbi:MAG: formimidoylglutamase [Psychrilyobacter sp.]|uniref:formimidoylglutamase n=1 Tax=Psychrilyobacter sp. TaxID=2586924 RepID=UPI003C75C557